MLLQVKKMDIRVQLPDCAIEDIFFFISGYRKLQNLKWCYMATKVQAGAQPR